MDTMSSLVSIEHLNEKEFMTLLSLEPEEKKQEDQIETSENDTIRQKMELLWEYQHKERELLVEFQIKKRDLIMAGAIPTPYLEVEYQNRKKELLEKYQNKIGELFITPIQLKRKQTLFRKKKTCSHSAIDARPFANDPRWGIKCQDLCLPGNEIPVLTPLGMKLSGLETYH